MKKLLMIIFLFCQLLIVNVCSAQSWQWFNQIGSPGTSQYFPDEYVNDMEVDADGNIYVCGRTFLGAQLNGVSLPGYGDQDAFVAKFNCSGQLVWYHAVGSAMIYNEHFNRIELSKNGHIYLTGNIAASSGFPATVIDTTFSTATSTFILLCLDTAGNRNWIKFAGTGCVAPSYSVGSDASNNLYILGTNANGCQIYPNLNIPTCYRYVAKLDSNGYALSYFILDTIPADDFEVDADGNLYFTGSISFQYMVGGQPVSPIGVNDLIVVKYDSAGNYKWLYQVGMPGGYNFGQMVKVDPFTKDVWVAGALWKNTPVGPFTITNSYSTTNGVVAAIKLDQNGNFLKLFQTHNQYPSGNDFINIGPTKVHFGGTFAGIVKIASDSLVSVGQYDIFFAEIDKGSNQLSLKGSLYCTGYQEQCFQISHDGSGNTYFAGAFDGTAIVNAQNFNIVGGKTDAFVVKWGNATCTVGINELNGVSQGVLSITPNPSSAFINIHANYLPGKKAVLYIYNITGQEVYHTSCTILNESMSVNINVQDLAIGFYTIGLQMESGKKLVEKFVKQ